MPEPSPLPKVNLKLFKREGLYYAIVQSSVFTEPLEIALHGINSEEEARAAAEVFRPPCPSSVPKE